MSEQGRQVRVRSWSRRGAFGDYVFRWFRDQRLRTVCAGKVRRITAGRAASRRDLRLAMRPLSVAGSAPSCRSRRTADSHHVPAFPASRAIPRSAARAGSESAGCAMGRSRNPLDLASKGEEALAVVAIAEAHRGAVRRNNRRPGRRSDSRRRARRGPSATRDGCPRDCRSPPRRGSNRQRGAVAAHHGGPITREREDGERRRGWRTERATGGGACAPSCLLSGGYGDETVDPASAPTPTGAAAAAIITITIDSSATMSWPATSTRGVTTTRRTGHTSGTRTNTGPAAVAM